MAEAKKTVKKKPAAKKPAAKKSPVKKATPVKKAVAKKTVAKKPAVKKAICFALWKDEEPMHHTITHHGNWLHSARQMLRILWCVTFLQNCLFLFLFFFVQT